MSQKKVTGFVVRSTDTTENGQFDNSNSNFKLTKSKIKEMYKDDKGVKAKLNKNSTSSTSIDNDISTIRNGYYNYNDLSRQWEYARDLYNFYPVFSNLIDSLSNMYLWRYTYIPRQVKERAEKADFNEVYNLMGEVVDGISIENTFPAILTYMFIYGVTYVVTVKDTSSKTISTIKLPNKYCKMATLTQYGTYSFLFDFQYFDSLGLSAAELEQIWDLYPDDFKAMYDDYLKDRTNKRWQLIDPRYGVAFALNENAFPTKLNAIFSIKQYDTYLANELERSNQQLLKIISHKMPTWEDKLVVGIEEMAELHSSMSKVLLRNSNVRLLTTFGDIDVKSIGEDQTKENKTLSNAYDAIYNNSGENNNIYTGESAEALKYSLARDASIVWKYINEFVNFYNITINNSFNFKGYQCDINMLPITVYNEQDKINLYKEGATLGVTKLEYIVSTGIKQINLSSKLKLEEYLKLDQLKPLSTSYTQNDNSKNKEDPKDNNNDNNNDDSNNDEDNEKIKKEQEVDVNEQNTK